MSNGILDHDTLEAIRILRQAVEQERVPGVLEFRLLSGALAQAIEAGREHELHEAARVFQLLDPDFRARVVASAREAATARVVLRGGARAVREPSAVTSPESAPHRAMSGFLSALNGVRPVRPRSG